VQVKICGVCRPEDAAVVSEAGADCIGVILAPGSRRTLGLDDARAVLAPARHLTKVGVFVDAPFDTVAHAVSHLGLDVVQLHGNESPEDVARLKQLAVVWKAIRVKEPDDVTAAAEAYVAADALLLDAWHPAQAGGTGIALDWQAIAGQRNRIRPPLRLVLAGGLTPDNVAAAARVVRPDVVDVSSGVETAPGIKSAERIHAFIAAAHSALASPTES